MNQIEKKRAQFSDIAKKIIIIGNPNVGKTTIFNKLCKSNVSYYTYPGTSIEVGVGWFTTGNITYEVIDTPGGNGLYDCSEDDNIIRNIILNEKEKIILQVSDFTNLKMSLRYTIELSELDTPMIFVFNMADEMRLRGVEIDHKSFHSTFGFNSIETIADEGVGIDRLKKEFSQAVVPKYNLNYPVNIENILEKSRQENLSRAHHFLNILKPESVKKFFDKKYIDERILSEADKSTLSIELIQSRVKEATRIEKQIAEYKPLQKVSFIEKFEKWTRMPVTGIPIFFLILLMLYLFVGLLGAGIIVDFIQIEIFENYIVHCCKLIMNSINISLLYDFFVGKYGIISFALTLCLGVVLPIVTTYFFAFSFIEESGYLPRLSVLLDRTLKKIGISGRAIMPIVLGFSCITMALLSTRILDSRKEKLITTMILILAIPCSAQSTILLAVISAISLKAFLFIVLFICFQIILSSYILNKYIAGEPSTFIMELLPLRFPSIRGVFYKTKLRVTIFMREIFPLFMIAGFLLFLLEKSGILHVFERIGRPVVTTFMGLPPETTSVLILNIGRKEAGTAVIKSLFDNQMLNEIQIITISVVTLLFVPCFSSFMVLIKEYGVKSALTMYFSVFAYAILSGGLVNYLLNIFY